MAKVQCRKFPDDLYEKLSVSADKNERSIEGHVRYLLSEMLNDSSVLVSDIPDWLLEALEDSARKEFRSIELEILKRLTDSFIGKKTIV